MVKFIKVSVLALFFVLISVNPVNAQVEINNDADAVKYIDNCIRNYEKEISFVSTESELDLDQVYDSGICQIYPNVENKGGLYSYNTKVKYSASKAECKKYYRTLDQISEWLSGEDDMTKVKKINWWIQNHITYGDNDYYDTAYDAIITGKAMCGGYAAVFRCFAENNGLEVKTVIGGIKDNESHAWNMVKINGKWLGIDTCWNEMTYNTDDWDEHGIVTSY